MSAEACSLILRQPVVHYIGEEKTELKEERAKEMYAFNCIKSASIRFVLPFFTLTG